MIPERKGPLDEVNKWYEVEPLENGVVVIGEPYHTEKVFCFLIKGQEKDLLFDTGMGVKPLNPLLAQLRELSKELVVVNSHWHFDHIGGNSQFGEVLTPKNKHEVEGILRGWTHKDLGKYAFFDGFIYGIPEDLNLEGFQIPGSPNISPVLVDGYRIELGGRSLRILETPGHTPGSICLFDETNGILFTSDLLYEGPLYAFENESNPLAYLNSLKRIRRELGEEIKIICPGHNYPENTCEPGLLEDAIRLFVMAKKKTTPDNVSSEYPGVVEYNCPGLSRRGAHMRRRLKVLVSEKI